jgi:hypothetical protein
MSACEDLDGPAHVETALAKRPLTLLPAAGNAHGLNVATLNRGVKGGSDSSLLSNTRINGRTQQSVWALYRSRTVSSRR